MDLTSENWENFSPEAEAELIKMKKSLRKRNCKLILTSVVLVIAILFSAVKCIIPAMEKHHWDPTVCSFLEAVPDLELSMLVYTELFGQGQILMPPEIRKTGFARYEIEACFLEWESQHSLTSLSYRSAALDRSIWSQESNFWNELQRGIIYRYPEPEENALIAEKQEKTKALLQELPDYVQIQASLTFSRDLSMKGFDAFTDRYSRSDANFIWAVLRSGDEGRSCGIHLTEYMSARYQPDFWNGTAYPELFPERYNWSASDMEQHVLSMLHFASDQVKNGTGIIPDWADRDIYDTYLAYMEENGVKVFGCYVITTPKLLLEMLEDWDISYVHLSKAWIGV